MPELTLKDKALRSRIKRFIKFSLPTSDNIYEHLVNVTQDCENARILTNLICDKGLSYRDINNYLSRFITKSNFLEAAIQGCDEWMNEFEEMKDLENKRKEDNEKNPIVNSLSFAAFPDDGTVDVFPDVVFPDGDDGSSDTDTSE